MCQASVKFQSSDIIRSLMSGDIITVRVRFDNILRFKYL